MSRITHIYIYTRMGLSGEALQARSSMNSVMIALNHDDTSKNLMWYVLPKIATETLQDSKQTSQNYQPYGYAPQNKKGVWMSSVPPKLRANLLAGTIDSCSSPPSG